MTPYVRGRGPAVDSTAGPRALRVAARVAAAAATWCVALGATVVLRDYLQRANFTFFWIAVLFAAWYAGFVAALVVAVASVLAVEAFVVAPRFELRPLTLTNAITLAIFVGASGLVSALAAARGRARRTRDAYAAQLEEQAIELEAQMEEARALAEDLERANAELEAALATAEDARGSALAAGDRVAGILGSLADSVAAYDAAWRITYLNPAARELLRAIGVDPDAAIGTVIWETVPSLRGTRFETETRRAVAERRVVDFVERQPAIDRWFDNRAVPGPEGGVTTYSRDVTERHRAQQATAFLAEASRVLAASLDYEATLRAVANAAVPTLGDWCAVDIVRDPERATWPPVLDRLAVVHRDPAMVALAGELTQRFPPDWSDRAPTARVLRERTPLLIPVVTDDVLVAAATSDEHLAALRTLRFASVLVVPLVARDVTLGMLTLVMSESGRRYDATDLALAQDLAWRAASAVDNARLFRDAEQARHEAEAANRAKSQFLSTMSHELRTPLNAITGYTELLEMGVRGPVSDAQQEDLRRIRRSANVLMSLVTDVLNFARLEVGHVDVALRSVRIDRVLADLEALVAPQVRAKRLAYRCATCGNGTHAHADAERLAQVLSNLLANAVKFTPEGGRIDVSCETTRDRVRVYVRDTGRGIPAERLDDIFEPFVQVDRHLTNASQQGVGLGLAISRDLARAMGGDLTVESAVGVGSTFCLSLPRAAAED